jgi:hypothetical protein
VCEPREALQRLPDAENEVPTTIPQDSAAGRVEEQQETVEAWDLLYPEQLRVCLLPKLTAQLNLIKSQVV